MTASDDTPVEPSEVPASAPPEPGVPTETVARAGGILSGAMAMSRVLGMLRDTAMTAAFSVGLKTDAYNLAITIPDTLFMLVAGGGLSSAFIPVFSELYHTKREKAAWKFFSVVTTVCSIAVLILLAAAWGLAPWIAQVMAHDKKGANGLPVGPEIIPQIVDMGRILLPAQFAFLIGSILLGTLYARKQFLAPALAPNVYNVGIIIGAVIGGRTPLGIYGMPWGGLVGAMIGNLVLPVFFMAKSGSEFKPSFDLKADGVKKFFVLLAPVILGFSLPSVVQIITNYFSASYPEGAVTVLRFGNTLMQAPNGIFGQALALAAFPVLTQFYANKRMDLYRDQVSRTLRTVIFLGLPSAVILGALAPQIIHLLYGYGKAAKDTNLDDVAVALRVYSIGVLPWCVQPVLMRGFFSVHKTLLPVVLSTSMTVLFILMCLFSVHNGLPYMSLAWGTDIAAWLLVVVLYIALEKSVGTLDRTGIGQTLVKSFVGSAAMGVVAFGVSKGLEVSGLGHSRLIEFFAFSATALFCLSVYYAIGRKLNMPETSYFDRALAKRKRKK